MKPVTDPTLLAELSGSAPPTARRPVTDPALLGALGRGAGAPVVDSSPGSDPSEAPDPSEGMPWYMKTLVGVGAGMSNVGHMALKVADKTGLLGDDAKATLKRQEEDRALYEKYHPGGAATVGEIIGEGVATLPVGGAVGAGAKVLTKALPALGRVGSVGGRIANVGQAGRAATEGAILGAAAADEGEALGGAARGAGIGAVLPGAVGALGAAGRKVVTELSPTVAAAGRRGYNALERTLGKEKLADVTNMVENPMPSGLPRTTAAMSADPRVGALERGARGRGNVDFAPHDRNVAEKAWGDLTSATSAADELPVLSKAPGQMMEEGKAVLDKIPLSKTNRDNIAKELIDLRNSNEVIANPALAKEIDSAIGALDNPKATLGVLPQLYWKMGQEAGDSAAIQKARSVIKGVADERSGGQFTNLQTGYGVAKDQLKGAEAAQAVRRKFVDEEGFPTTSNYYGDVGQSPVPVVESAPLRRAVNQQSRKGAAAEIDPAELEKMGRLADQLRAHEIYKPSSASGGSAVGLGASEGAASTALNASPLWRLRGALGSVFKGLNERSQKAVDQALLDPEAFKNMVEAKKALKLPLEKWEEVLQQTLGGVTRAAVIPSGD